MAGTSPPGPFRCGSTTWSTNPAATAASKAFPPRSSIAIPAAEASQCVEATMPKVPRSSGRVVKRSIARPHHTAVSTLVSLPAWNEAENLPAVLEEVRLVLPEADLLVVDDGSTHPTAGGGRGGGGGGG